jgi:CRP/FNR family transcriptional regulator
MLALSESVDRSVYPLISLPDHVRPSNTVQDLLSRQPLRRFSGDEHLFYEEDAARNTYRIESGIVALYKILGNGRRQIMSLRFAGDIVGLDAATSRHCGAMALSPVIARSVTQNMIERLVDGRPEAASEIIDLMAAELESTRRQITLLNRRSALEKLAAFILELDQRQAARPPRRGLVSVPMSRTDIADFLGLTIETVSRNLTKLKLRKIIRLPDIHTIVITDRAELMCLAEGDDTYSG